MTTEREDWKARYNDNGQNEEGQNRERRPYQSYNRSNYGNNQEGYRQDNHGSYNRQGGNYDQQGSGNYNRPRPNYDRSGSYSNNRQGGNNYDNRQGGNNYDNRQGGNNYDNGYNQRPQRSYDNQGNDNDQSNGLVKKRRPRVGEINPSAKPNYNSDRQMGGYRDNRGGNYQQGGYQQRPQRGNRPQQSGGYNRNPRNNRDSNYDPNAKYSVQKQQKYREENFDPNEPIRLNKYLANAGICSRREADEFIQAGVVKVNDIVVTELGTKVKRADLVKFHDETIKLEHKIYILLNKPKNCVTTADDPQERFTVMDLVKNACHERIFPVGRLDRNTTGVLLLTNDGDLASKLTHPKFLKKKIYHVWLDKDVAIADMQKLAEGIDLEDGEIHADAISYVTDTDKDQVGIEIHSGRNRIVRRMFESLGYHVQRLDRVYFAGLTKKNLKKGHWRFLNEKEVSMLRMGAFD
jgi:23S rRNA pseudouridine2605 synthase